MDYIIGPFFGFGHWKKYCENTIKMVFQLITQFSISYFMKIDKFRDLPILNIWQIISGLHRKCAFLIDDTNSYLIETHLD